ncbi:replicative DNA helicase [Ureaplasma diversum]|nr:DnaB-like helicase C-terminal domain-containing protein [Ureaplasma diversum]
MAKTHQNMLIEALRKIIKAILVDNLHADVALNKINPKHLDSSIGVIKDIFLAIYKLKTSDRSINLETILSVGAEDSSKVNKLDQLEKIKEEINIILDIELSYSESLEDLIDIVKIGITQQNLKDFATNLLNLNIGLNNYLVEYDNIRDQLLQILSDVSTSSMKSINSVVDEYKEKLNDFKTENKSPDLVPTGYSGIDAFTNNGFRPGELVVIAARPGMGKTTFALNVVVNNIKRIMQQNEEIEQQIILNQMNKINVKNKKTKCIVIFSLEMPNEQILKKMIAAETHIPSREIEKLDFLKHPEYETNKKNNSAFASKLKEINHWPIYMDDKNPLTILDIESKLREIAKKNDIAFVVIDYLQLISPTEQGSMNRAQEVGKISQKLKSLAKDLKTPIIALAQLSRQAENRASSGLIKNNAPKGMFNSQYDDSGPKLSDLRESGSIEQDADIVAFIHYDRAAVVNLQNSNNNNSQTYDQSPNVKFDIAKNRSGTTGYVILTFNKQISRFFAFK